MRICLEGGCDLPVTGLRSRRCDNHKRERRNAQERVRYHRDSQFGHEPMEELGLMPVVDYTEHGAKPGIARETFRTEYAPRPMESADDVVIDYTQGGSPRPSIYSNPPERSNVPPLIRHDHSRYQRDQALAAKQGEHADRADMPWTDLQATAAAYESGQQRVVSFDGGPGDYDAPRYDHLGRPYRNRGGRR